MASLVIIEDDLRVRTALTKALEQRGHVVMQADSAMSGLQLVVAHKPEVIVLDLGLPDLDGAELLRMLRPVSDAVVIVATARVSEEEIVRTLDAGADDYVTKPFSPRELVARVRTVLRRAQPSTDVSEMLRFDGLVIDRSSREATLDAHVVALTAKEFDLLAYLAASPRQVFSRSQLLHDVWDSSPEYQDPATVTVHVRRLRHKMEADPENPRWITTVWGVGYRFEP